MHNTIKVSLFFLGDDFRFQNYPWPYNGYVYSVTATRQSWNSSRENCEGMGAQLAVYGVKDYATRV